VQLRVVRWALTALACPSSSRTEESPLPRLPRR
jgi:hypothetical protein